MEENELFLKYLIDEKIYFVDDKTTPPSGYEQGTVKDGNKGFDEEETNGVSRPTAKVGIPEVDTVAAKVESTEVGKAMEEGHGKDTAKSGDTLGTVQKSSAVEGEDTADTGSSGDNKPVKKYRDISVILLDYNDQTSMPPGHKDLLARILQSVNLNLESVEMVFRDEFDKLDVKGFTDCPVIAFLTRIPEHINSLFAVEKYMINIIDGNQFVACDSLNDLSNDRLLKRKLWEQLKLIYGP
jgi:DNA polymerase III psi subunit